MLLGTGVKYLISGKFYYFIRNVELSSHHIVVLHLALLGLFLILPCEITRRNNDGIHIRRYAKIFYQFSLSHVTVFEFYITVAVCLFTFEDTLF